MNLNIFNLQLYFLSIKESDNETKSTAFLLLFLAVMPYRIL
ncbi:hypothetical protein SRABI04_00515 [Chryseobacterium sp. Bi04]|nr:hypothetical protein SRABI04_00515 [Chryseobacterium sp. Bi04]